MIKRYYICDNCDHSFDTYQPMGEKLKKRCPNCKKNKLYQDLSGLYTSVKQCNTIGSLAEENTRKLGKYGLEEKEAKAKEKDDQIMKNKRDRLRASGLKVLEPNESSPKLSKENYKKIIKNGQLDKKAAIKYIKDGKI